MAIVLGYVVFVTSYLLLWEHYPAWQTILNRVSWSTADFIALAATMLALYTYYLFEKGISSNMPQQLMDWASKPENQPKLNAVLKNILACEATGQALEIAIEVAKKKITSSFEGRAGAEIKAFRKGIALEFPDSVQKLFANKWFDNAVKAVGILDGLLKTLKGKGPGDQNEPPSE
jgi:hypothetical protein